SADQRLPSAIEVQHRRLQCDLQLPQRSVRFKLRKFRAIAGESRESGDKVADAHALRLPVDPALHRFAIRGRRLRERCEQLAEAQLLAKRERGAAQQSAEIGRESMKRAVPDQVSRTASQRDFAAVLYAPSIELRFHHAGAIESMRAEIHREALL